MDRKQFNAHIHSLFVIVKLTDEIYLGPILKKQNAVYDATAHATDCQ